ncbi:MAG: hypothetical protein CSA58_00650 [Micrococcales bacterium]|nr:MAG: hypothetical protein CSA58_00650 [Micrococcales bacterium]
MAIKAADVAKVALAAGKLVAGMTGHGAGWAHVDAAVSVGKAVKGLHGKKSPSRSPGQRLVDEVADAVTAAVNGSEWADLNPDQVDTVGRAVARALQDADVDDALVVAARDGADALLAQVSNLATTRSTRASLADPVTLEPLFDLMLRTVVHTVAPRVLSEPGFLAAVARQTLRDSAATKDALGSLVDTQVATADPQDLVAYLQARVEDWDRSVLQLGPRSPSEVERRLTVQHGTGTKTETWREVAALEGARRVVVLGGPGAGKSWLAQRYARRAARTALRQLAGGIDPSMVEMPIFTTWDTWVHAVGSRPTLESLVDASFASGLGRTDLGDDRNQRLRRGFLRPACRLLAVVDSLDEASTQARQDQRWHELQHLPRRCRLVITSRPAAWHDTHPSTAETDSSTRIVAIEDFTAQDVREVVQAWFTDTPDLATGLLGQRDRRDDLRRNARVPLLLTFYCLLTEDQDNPDHQLPTQRHELYDQITNLLLTAPRRPTGPNRGLNIAACKQALGEWAFDAVVCKQWTDPVTGLGAWGELFTHPSGHPRSRARNRTRWSMSRRRWRPTMRGGTRPAGSCTAPCWNTTPPNTSPHCPLAKP